MYPFIPETMDDLAAMWQKCRSIYAQILVATGPFLLPSARLADPKVQTAPP